MHWIFKRYIHSIENNKSMNNDFSVQVIHVTQTFCFQHTIFYTQIFNSFHSSSGNKIFSNQFFLELLWTIWTTDSRANTIKRPTARWPLSKLRMDWKLNLLLAPSTKKASWKMWKSIGGDLTKKRRVPLFPLRTIHKFERVFVLIRIRIVIRESFKYYNERERYNAERTRVVVFFFVCLYHTTCAYLLAVCHGNLKLINILCMIVSAPLFFEY